VKDSASNAARGRIGVQRRAQLARHGDLARRVVAIDHDLDLVALGDPGVGPEGVGQPEHGVPAVDGEPRAERDAVDRPGDGRAGFAPQLADVERDDDEPVLQHSREALHQVTSRTTFSRPATGPA
jgi:hypothetical protein